MLDRYIRIELDRAARDAGFTHGVFDRQRQRTIESGTEDAVRGMVDSYNRRERYSRTMAARRGADPGYAAWEAHVQRMAAVRASVERPPAHFDRGTEGF